MQLLAKQCGLNAGVFVADLDNWARLNIAAQLLFWLDLNTREQLYDGEEIGAGSQGPMLIVFNNRRTALEPAWHVPHLGFARGRRYSREYETTGIGNLFHWSGPSKPWLVQHGALLPEVWREFCVAEPDLSPDECGAVDTNSNAEEENDNNSNESL